MDEEKTIASTQCGNPQGEEGRSTLERMNSSHDALSRWGLSCLPDIGPSEILDIGCGGGNMLNLLGRMYPSSKLIGIDPSDTALELTSETAADLMSAERLAVLKGDVSDLPFEGGSFDLATAVETYFFWPDLARGLEEAARVLRRGGILLIVSESYPHPDFEERNAGWSEMTGMRLVDNQIMIKMLGKAGFEATATTVEDSNWVAFVAVKR
jgi:ubiquinone/menaquinone biosynthesis C-methylase UbiE